MTDVRVDLRRTSNQLLSGLSSDAMLLLQPLLERHELVFRAIIQRPHEVMEHTYFIESGLVSMIAKTSQDRQVEIAVVGREGMIGTMIVLGADRSPDGGLVQVPGMALRITTADLSNAMSANPSIRARLLLYVQAYLVQVSQTALANSRGNVEQRLARWIAMAHDRVDGDVYEQTHEFLSLMLGVRRAGVTVALHNLEGEGLIRAKRGAITILDREGLNIYANGLYGPPEREYARLLASPSLDPVAAAPGHGSRLLESNCQRVDTPMPRFNNDYRNRIA